MYARLLRQVREFLRIELLLIPAIQSVLACRFFLSPHDEVENHSYSGLVTRLPNIRIWLTPLKTISFSYSRHGDRTAKTVILDSISMVGVWRYFDQVHLPSQVPQFLEFA
jgi:hypothetical protein